MLMNLTKLFHHMISGNRHTLMMIRYDLKTCLFNCCMSASALFPITIGLSLSLSALLVSG